jgi:hypothetical protein
VLTRIDVADVFNELLNEYRNPATPDRQQPSSAAQAAQ